MAEVKFDEVDKVYDNGVHAVHDLTLETLDGEFLVLVGPSGCGKTTALRMVAGLEEISDGTVTIGGRVVNDLSPKERDIAMVFQNYALYPHLSVAENIAFGLRLRKEPKAVIDERVAWAAKLLDLTPVPAAPAEGALRRPAPARGDGARDRAPAAGVPDGRAALEPRREAPRPDARRHLEAPARPRDDDDLRHARPGRGDDDGRPRGGDEHGVLQQVDTPQRLYDHPANLFVAGFIGTPPMNLIEASVSVDGDDVTLSIGPQPIPLAPEALRRYPGLRGADGRRVVIGVRPATSTSRRDRPDLPTVTAHLELVEALGTESIAYFRIDAMAISAEVHGGGRGAEDAEGVTATRPNLVVAVPARVGVRPPGRHGRRPRGRHGEAARVRRGDG